MWPRDDNTENGASSVYFTRPLYSRPVVLSGSIIHSLTQLSSAQAIPHHSAAALKMSIVVAPISVVDVDLHADLAEAAPTLVMCGGAP